MSKNLESIGYSSLTKVQQESIPLILKGKDLLVKAKTGSGKTAAFGIPIIETLNGDKKLRVLILCPTRELATQVSSTLRKLARFKKDIKILTILGGESFKKQQNSLKHGTDILVATPGRLIDHINNSSLLLDSVKLTVLDEADKMLDMGFLEDVEYILKQTSKDKQLLLFSATFNQKIENLSSTFQNNRIKIEITEQKPDIKTISYKVSDKLSSLEKILNHYKPNSVIVFVNTKDMAQELENYLKNLKYDIKSIHGNLEQWERDERLIEFKNGSINILVATDLASRGLDIDDIEMIINYEIPHKEETYIHRIGRTARMNKKGVVINLLNHIPNYLKTVDEFSLHVKNNPSYRSSMQTLCINGGKKSKLRAGDILGALVKTAKIEPSLIGKIIIQDEVSYIAINKTVFKKAYDNLKHSKIKNKEFKIWKL